VPPILPPKDGFLFLDREKFHASFAGDLPDEQAAFMADSQVPWGVDALAGSVTEAAWRTKPSWYLVATDDRMIPPPAQRAMPPPAGSTGGRRGGAPPRRIPPARAGRAVWARAGGRVVAAAASHSIYVSQPAAVVAL